jgi:hypothetical protein
MKYKSLLLVLALTFGTVGVASAQSNRNWGWQDRDRRDNDRDWDRSNQKAFRDGYNDGQKAARHRGNSGKYNNHYRDRDDRAAYDAGYRRGIGNNNGPWSNNNGNNGDWRNDRDRNHDGRDDRTGHPFGGVLGQQQGNYPNNGGYGIGNARNVGYNDGLLAGQKDRSTGHSFRPTQNKGYQDADKGYSSSIGDKNQYKQVYRDGFMQGYQRGYYGR